MLQPPRKHGRRRLAPEGVSGGATQRPMHERRTMKLAAFSSRMSGCAALALLACTAGCSSIGYSVAAGRAAVRYSASEIVDLDASSMRSQRDPTDCEDSASAMLAETRTVVLTGTAENVWFFNQPPSICADLSIAWIELDPGQVFPTQPSCRVIKLHFDQHSEPNIQVDTRWELHFTETGEFLDLRRLRDAAR